MLRAVTLSGVMLNVIMMSVIHAKSKCADSALLSVVLLHAIRLCVVVPLLSHNPTIEA